AGAQPGIIALSAFPQASGSQRQALQDGSADPFREARGYRGTDLPYDVGRALDELVEELLHRVGQAAVRGGALEVRAANLAPSVLAVRSPYRHRHLDLLGSEPALA